MIQTHDARVRSVFGLVSLVLSLSFLGLLDPIFNRLNLLGNKSKDATSKEDGHTNLLITSEPPN
jgi:hypothetical protein